MRLQNSQWQADVPANGCVTSKRTAPHRHLPWSGSIALVRGFVPALEPGAEVVQEEARVRAVDEAVVVRERQVHDRADRDHVVPELVLNDPRALDERVRAEDRRLRLVDDRRPVEGPEAARVRDRERSALDVVRQELLRARPLGEVLDRPRDPREVQVLRIPDDRDDEAPALLEGDGDPEVDELAGDDALTPDLAVHPRVLLERVDGRPRDEAEVGEVDAVCGKLGLELLAEGDDAREIDLDRARDVGAG